MGSQEETPSQQHAQKIKGELGFLGFQSTARQWNKCLVDQIHVMGLKITHYGPSTFILREDRKLVAASMVRLDAFLLGGVRQHRG